MSECQICRRETVSSDLTHLKLYVTGSEGVSVCLECRMALTEVARSLIRANLHGRKSGYMAAKTVAEAKAASGVASQT